MTKENKPEIRFSGFSDAWKQRKFGDFAKVSMCKRIFKEETTQTGDVPFFKIGTFGGIPDAFISRYKFESYKAKYPYPKKGDILISASGSIGRIVEYSGKDEYFQDSNIIWLDHDESVLNSFLKHVYSIIKWNGIEGTTIKRLYNDNVLTTKILTPSLEEQSKIGTFFTQLDNTITLQLRKLELLKNQKKAFLEKMFPKEGENVPEIRFSGFSDAWEQRKLDELANRYDNLRIPVAESERIHGDIPYYGANGIQDYVEGFTHDGEYILVAEDGANDLKNYPVHYVNGKVWVNNHAHVLQAKDCCNTKFLKYVFQTTDLTPFLVGGGRAKLNADVMMQLVLNVPSNIEEQNKIAEFIFKIEDLITLQLRKLEILKNIKKSFLQKMFV